jgi:hypothetical protein
MLHEDEFDPTIGDEIVFGPPAMTTPAKMTIMDHVSLSGAQLFDFLMDPRSGEPPGK